MAQSYNGLNYNWNPTSSPYSAMNQNTAYFYQPASPVPCQINQSNQFYYNTNQQFFSYNNTFLSTPNTDNKSFSSGYASENSSFNSPLLTKSYGYYNNNLIQNNLNQVFSQNETKKSSKRSRDDEHTSNENKKLSNVEIINQIFDNQEPVAKKQKRAYKKKEQQSLQSVQQPIQLLSDITNIDFLGSNIESNENYDDLNEEEFENFDLNFIDNDLSLNSRQGDKKKRVLTRNQRIAANMRERKRMGIMNESFIQLREALPITTGRKRRKMSRLDIVVGALEYISYLDSLLEKDVPSEIDFDAYQNSLYLS